MKIQPKYPALIVDDDPSMRVAIEESLWQTGISVLSASSGEEALAICQNKPVGVVITDMKMPGMSGLELFKEIKRLKLPIPVIIMSAFGTIQVAVDAVKMGVFDYLVKPFSQETLCGAIQKALSTGEAGEKPAGAPAGKTFLTQDPAMLKTLKMAEVVAASDASILIQGESGTGKELVARFIFTHSPRAHRPFIAINCAAVPENLLESELFGYEKGAFTGAVAKKPGRFELANSGTILLDEVSEMPILLQAKLLRVLQERELDVLGGKAPVLLDIRVIATTNRPLWGEVEAGRFREDLYYRLNVFPIHLPPLRDRISDIPLLVAHFIAKGAVRNQREVTSISKEAILRLMGQEWRGNVRQLENVVERAVLLAGGGPIGEEHLLFEGGMPGRAIAPVQHHAAPPAGGTTLWEAERKLILETLEQVGGNRTHAARGLGISIRTLRNKLREYRELNPSLFPSSLVEEEEGNEEKKNLVEKRSDPTRIQPMEGRSVRTAT